MEIHGKLKQENDHIIFILYKMPWHHRREKRKTKIGGREANLKKHCKNLSFNALKSPNIKIQKNIHEAEPIQYNACLDVGNNREPKIAPRFLFE